MKWMFALTTLVLAAGALAQPSAAPATEPAPASIAPARVVPGVSPQLAERIPDIESRLTGLSADRPTAYLELGELILEESASPADRQLARELFVLALSTSAERPHDPEAQQTGSSACIALASTTDDQELRRWLGAIGASLTPDTGLTASLRPASASAASRDPAALDVATLLGYVRTGEGKRAERLLTRPGVDDLLVKMDRVLIPHIGGGAQNIKRLINQYPWCPQCRNRRTIKNADGIHLCPTCKGVPGPEISATQLIDQLRTESVLLSGTQKTWAAQTIADGGAPLRDLEPREVAAVLGIDPNRTTWQVGSWMVPKGKPKAAPSKPKPAAADTTPP